MKKERPFSYSSSTSSASTCPDHLRRICDQEIPTANIAEIKTRTTQLTAVTLFKPNHPQSMNNHNSVEKNRTAKIKPINPSERRVALR